MCAQPSFSAEFVLLDDNLALTDYVAAFLCEHGHSCATLAGGIESWLAENNCEVLVVDLSMPDTDIADLIASVRANNANLPIIIFSSLGYAQEQMNAALRAGANGYVSKNLPMEQLYCVLSRVLATARDQGRRPRPVLLGVA